MSRTPAKITQADVARTIRAARQAGAREVEVRFTDGTRIAIKLTETVDGHETPLAPVKESVL